MEKKRGKRLKPIDDGIWDCSVCTYKNSAEAFKCAMCDVRKGTSTRKPKPNPQLVAQQAVQQLAAAAKKQASKRSSSDRFEHHSDNSEDSHRSECMDKAIDTSSNKSRDGSKFNERMVSRVDSEKSIPTASSPLLPNQPPKNLSFKDAINTNHKTLESSLNISSAKNESFYPKVDMIPNKAANVTSAQDKATYTSTNLTNNYNFKPQLPMNNKNVMSMEVTVAGLTVVITESDPKTFRSGNKVKRRKTHHEPASSDNNIANNNDNIYNNVNSFNENYLNRGYSPITNNNSFTNNKNINHTFSNHNVFNSVNEMSNKNNINNYKTTTNDSIKKFEHFSSPSHTNSNVSKNNDNKKLNSETTESKFGLINNTNTLNQINKLNSMENTLQNLSNNNQMNRNIVDTSLNVSTMASNQTQIGSAGNSMPISSQTTTTNPYVPPNSCNSALFVKNNDQSFNNDGHHFTQTSISKTTSSHITDAPVITYNNTQPLHNKSFTESAAISLVSKCTTSTPPIICNVSAGQNISNLPKVCLGVPVDNDVKKNEIIKDIVTVQDSNKIISATSNDIQTKDDLESYTNRKDKISNSLMNDCEKDDKDIPQLNESNSVSAITDSDVVPNEAKILNRDDNNNDVSIAQNHDTDEKDCEAEKGKNSSISGVINEETNHKDTEDTKDNTTKTQADKTE